MFTDQPVTPLHVESLLTFLRTNAKRKLTRDDIRNSFQPDSLTDKQVQSKEAIKAILDLELAGESERGIELLPREKGKPTPRDAVISALDDHILNSTKIEDYLALFYSYMLGMNERALDGRGREEWVLSFNRDVFDNVQQSNQFNSTKLTGLYRWFAYMGLGWHDQSGEFICNPYFRVLRCMHLIFGDRKKLECDHFMHKLAEACPELDGGDIFLRANKRYDASAMQCTLGLSHALIDLHLNGAIVLHCPKDSAGWSIALANPPKDEENLMSDKISQIQLANVAKGDGT